MTDHQRPTTTPDHPHPMTTTKYQLYIYLSKNKHDEEWNARYKQKVRTHNQKIQDAAWGTTFPTAANPDSGFDLFMPNNGEEYETPNILRSELRNNTPPEPLPLHVGVDGARSLNLGVRCCMRVDAASAATATSTSTTTITTDPVAHSIAAQPVSITTTTTHPLQYVATDLPSAAPACGFYLYPRSSISKTRMRLANSVGIIDAGYRGDLIAAVDTIGLFGSTDIWRIWKETLSPIKKYDRYFQVCAPDLSPFLVHIVDTEQDLSPPTERGQGGFGSTGV